MINGGCWINIIIETQVILGVRKLKIEMKSLVMDKNKNASLKFEFMIFLNCSIVFEIFYTTCFQKSQSKFESLQRGEEIFGEVLSLPISSTGQFYIYLFSYHFHNCPHIVPRS